MAAETTISLAELSLFPATPDQVLESRTRHAVQWGRGQSLKDYVYKDELMEKDEHAAGGNLITWVLAPRSDPTTLNFMCSCETYRRTAVIAIPGASPSDSDHKSSSGTATHQVRDVIAYGVASVYTPPQYRKKGYAHHMMRLLHWVLAPRASLPSAFPAEWGLPPDPEMLAAHGVANAQFSVLYSDVGKDFYRSCGTGVDAHDGWLVSGATETFWNLSESADAGPKPNLDKSDSSPNIKRLTDGDVLALYKHDALWIKEDLAHGGTFTSDGQGPRTLFSFLPDKGVGAFVIRRRMEFVGPEMRPVLPTSQWGAALLPDGAQTLSDVLSSGTPPSPFSFVTWTLELRSSPPTLVVGRLRADVRTLPILLDELLAVAREEKVEKVEFWYLHPELRAVAEARGWRTEARTDHLSAVKWYGEEKEETLEWVYNEKFCWC